MPVKNQRFSPATRAICAAGVLAAWAWLLAPAVADASIIETTGSVAVGDFDGDGDREFAVGSPETDCAKGTVYVVSFSPASRRLQLRRARRLGDRRPARVADSNQHER